jgi:hypothetical protein
MARIPGTSYGTRAALSPTEINSLLGKPAPLIVPKQFPGLPSVPLKPGTALARGIEKTPDDAYAIALGKERARIDNEKRAWTEKQATDRAALAKQNETASTEWQAALTALNEIKNIMAGAASSGGAWRPAHGNLEEAQARADAAEAALTAGTNQLKEFDATYDARTNAYLGPMETNYKDAVGLATTLRDNTKKQTENDAAYARAREAYESAVTQHDKDRAAYDMYKAQKGQYDQDSLNRQADIDAGRYAVNPYAFMAQGAKLNEIEELRKQVNGGNLRPNMRVPDELVAPTEVKDPGEWKTGEPVHERVQGPQGYNLAAGDILGYKAPTEKPADDPALAHVSTEKTDTTSVAPGYTAPADKAKKPEPEKDPSGNPVVPPTTNNLQATAATAPAAPTQQTAEQAATPAPKLPEQPSGTVGGQGASTGQAPVEDPAQPPKEEKPKPFSEDNKEQDEDKNVW